MEIIETHFFTRRIHEFLTDEEYAEFQHELVDRPDSGKLIPGSGGLRKIRWSVKGRGKSGGIRVIYYWFLEPHKILLLFAYSKNVQGDLTRQQLKILQKVVAEELK